MTAARPAFDHVARVVWRQVAEEIGGEYVDGTFAQAEGVQLRSGDRVVTLDAPVGPSGISTRIRTPCVLDTDLAFDVQRTGFASGVYHAFGFQDLEVGDGLFDVYFRVKGSPEEAVKRLFGDPELQSALRALPRVRLRLHEGGRLGSSLPEGLRMLEGTVPGVVSDPAVLRGLFELAATAFAKVAGGHADDSTSLEALLVTLAAPGGRVVDRGLVLWDGDAPRLRAAEALAAYPDPRAADGLLAVLDHVDDRLRAAAIEALGDVGDARAIGPLVPFLGEPDRVGARSLRETARAALDKLGAGALTTAFQDALDGRLGRASAGSAGRDGSHPRAPPPESWLRCAHRDHRGVPRRRGGATGAAATRPRQGRRLGGFAAASLGGTGAPVEHPPEGDAGRRRGGLNGAARGG